MGKALGTYLQEKFPTDDESKYQAKDAVREWLKNVDLPDYGSPETIKKLLVILVDEPE